jgi:hypothetical protein
MHQDAGGTLKSHVPIIGWPDALRRSKIGMGRLEAICSVALCIGSIAQGLKPTDLIGLIGTTEVVPFQKRALLVFSQALKPQRWFAAFESFKAAARPKDWDFFRRLVLHTARRVLIRLRFWRAEGICRAFGPPAWRVRVPGALLHPGDKDLSPGFGSSGWHEADPWRWVR